MGDDQVQPVRPRGQTNDLWGADRDVESDPDRPVATSLSGRQKFTREITLSGIDQKRTFYAALVTANGGTLSEPIKAAI